VNKSVTNDIFRLWSYGSAVCRGWLLFPLGSLGRFIDDPGTTLPRQVPPDPLDGNEKALLEIDEEIDVDKRPKQPSRPTFQRPFAKVENGGVPADHCRVAAVLKLET
jgi:hypothetical protein